MRTRLVLFLDLIIVYCCTACVFEENRNASSALGETPPASPITIEYATDLGRSWFPGFQKGMWRTETDAVRASGKVHIVAEAQCPDRYRVVVTGAENSEQIFVDKTMYQRNGNGPWSVRPMPMHHMILSSCGKGGPPPDDPARFRLLAEQFQAVEVTGPKLRKINGHECREWTRQIEDVRVALPVITCYDTKTHGVVQSRYGDQSTTFDWDVKVDIKPPI